MDLVESYAQDLRFARKTFTRALLGLLLLAVAVFPWVAPDYMIFIATLVALYSISTRSRYASPSASQKHDGLRAWDVR